ncbi:MAG: efflux RND transporter permease subunit, partial [Candidatus Firestonebacteria bacterium]
NMALVWIEFILETNTMDAEQQVRSKVALAKAKMPKEIDEPVIERFSFTDQPVITAALEADVSSDVLYEYADKEIKPLLEQVNKVSRVEIFGGSKREIQVLLDRKTLDYYTLSVSQVAQAIGLSGQNIPLGKRPDSVNPGKEWVYRSLGEFNTVQDINNVTVKFIGNDVPIRLSQLAKVADSSEDETSRAFINGKKGIAVNIYKQNGSNTADVADKVKKCLKEINKTFSGEVKGGKLSIVRDSAVAIRNNIFDVSESIMIGIILVIIVVFLFLANVRSTVITGLALPNSLIGAFILVFAAGFSVNMLTLLALSLSVGLLVDDAIVVRENIFRHIQMGKDPADAARAGTKEVMLAVIATTLAIMSVFGPIAFVGGIAGKFLREFGLTVCFVMLISLFDALTMGPMLSAKFISTKVSDNVFARIWRMFMAPITKSFDAVQKWMNEKYEKVLRISIKFPFVIIGIAVVLFVLSLLPLRYNAIPMTFLPPPDQGEFKAELELEPGASLDAAYEAARKMDEVVRKNPEVELTTLVVGGNTGANKAEMFIKLVPPNKRKIRGAAFKDKLRGQLTEYKKYNLAINDYDTMFGGQKPFTMTVTGNEELELEASAKKILGLLENHPGFVEPDMSFKPGKPEMKLIYDEQKTKQLGISTLIAGAEIRAQVEGVTPAKFREQGKEWDIRVRLQDSDRDLKESFSKVKVPNVNYRLININQAAKLVSSEGPSTIQRSNGLRSIKIESDIGSKYGVGDLIGYLNKEIKDKNLLASGMSYRYEGQGEQFEEMSVNMMLAAVLAVLFIYMVLSSLYESFATPFTLLLPLPLAVTGALLALWLAGQSLNIFSIIGIIMLFGIATKNSILLVDYTKQLAEKGLTLKEAIIEAGKTRLRPIIMTSLTLVAGTIPVAIGLNEAAKQRTAMGWVIVGGVITSTLLTLVVVPAAIIFGQRVKWFFAASLQRAVIYFKEARYYILKNAGKAAAKIIHAFLQVFMNFAYICGSEGYFESAVDKSKTDFENYGVAVKSALKDYITVSDYESSKSIFNGKKKRK